MIHGKQIKDTSLLLNKLNPVTGQTLTLLGTSKIQQNAVPTTGIDLVNKEYVDALVTGLDFKNSCIVATIANINLASAPATIDGITVVNGGRVLVKDQTNGEENGIYIYNGATNAMTRATDADNNPNDEVTGGMFVFIEEGTWSDTGWVLATNNPIILDTTVLNFVQFSAAGVITANNGLTKTINNIQLGGLLLNHTTIDGDSGTYQMLMQDLQSFDMNSTGTLSQINFTSTNSTTTKDSVLGLNPNDVQLYMYDNTNDIEVGLNFNPSIETTIFFDDTVTNNRISNLKLATQLAQLRFEDTTNNILHQLMIDNTITYLGSLNTNTTNESKLELVPASSLLTTIDGISGDQGSILIQTTNVKLTVDIGSGADNTIDMFASGQGLAGGDISTNNTMIIKDDIENKGLVYNDDYTANFTENSLITKKYVDDNGGGIDTQLNKNMIASVTTTTGQQIAAAIAAIPRNDSYIQVYINGVKVVVGDAVNTREVYFADAGSLGTPKAISDVTTGDVLVRGTVLGYDTDATDIVEYDYQV